MTMIEPLTESQERLLARCPAEFRGYTFIVSMPTPAADGSGAVFRVLEAAGFELGDASRRFMHFIS